MITSLLEPCLIIPNYAARHLVLSVSTNTLPEQQLARCSVCVQSLWYHRWACSPILAGYNAGIYAVVLIIQHGIVQEGVYSVFCCSLFSPICYAVYPNMEHGVFQALHVADALTHRDCMHSLCEKDTLPARQAKVPVLTCCFPTYCRFLNFLSSIWLRIKTRRVHIDRTEDMNSTKHPGSGQFVKSEQTAAFKSFL